MRKTISTAHSGEGFRRPGRLPGELVRVLESDIIYRGHELAPRLVEEEIASRYDISRSPVREALRELEHSGLIVRGAKGGMRVPPLSIDDLDEVYACRIALEELAAGQAARSRTGDDLASMRQIFDEMNAAHAAHDVPGYFRLNVALSSSFHEATHNQTLVRLLATIDKQAQRYRYMAYVRSPELLDLSLEENRGIVQAIAARKPKAARKITRHLIRSSWRSIAVHLRNRPE